MATDRPITKIQLNGATYDIIVPNLEIAVNEIQQQLSVLKEDIYCDGTYMSPLDAIKRLDNKLQNIEKDLYSNIGALYSQIDMLRPETIAQTENPKQKFDLEIFREIEESNPFLLNLK